MHKILQNFMCFEFERLGWKLEIDDSSFSVLLKVCDSLHAISQPVYEVSAIVLRAVSADFGRPQNSGKCQRPKVASPWRASFSRKNERADWAENFAAAKFHR